MADSTFATSSGLAALMMLARLNGVDADQEQLRSQLGTDNIRLPEMVRAAKLLGFDASVTHSTWELMAAAVLPGIAALRTGEFLIVAKIADDKILVQHPLAPKAQVLTRAEFEARWDGRLFLMSRQAVPQQSAVRLAAGSWSWEALHKSGPRLSNSDECTENTSTLVPSDATVANAAPVGDAPALPGAMSRGGPSNAPIMKGTGAASSATAVPATSKEESAALAPTARKELDARAAHAAGNEPSTYVVSPSVQELIKSIPGAGKPAVTVPPAIQDSTNKPAAIVAPTVPQISPANQALAGGTPATGNASAGAAAALPAPFKLPDNKPAADAERAPANPQAANAEKAAARQERINPPAATAEPAARETPAAAKGPAGKSTPARDNPSIARGAAPSTNVPAAAAQPSDQAARDKAPEISTGLAAFVMLARFLGVPADPEQIRHRLGTTKIGTLEMLRAAKQLGLKARVQATRFPRLAKAPLPGIAVLRDGEFLLIGKAADDKVLVQSRLSSQPRVLTREDFEAIWTGQLFLMTRRVGLAHLTRRFDITWFLGAIYKYRKLFGEVLLASFFLQIFGLVTPLFFQVIIDKVLVHRGMSTLDVLIFAMIAISAFEGILGGLRTYLFAHTTNRVDVELGARLFHHLLALPLAYFQARRAGDSVARVRELENIRNFLTSSALTLVIDLFFAFVFIVVMFFYSPLLTGIVIAAFPFYIGISAGLTPLFRRRLEEKFDRGAENQAFLVESVTGVETLKAMAIEPQMQRRWEEQLAGYVAASFRVTTLANWASQWVQFISKLVSALTLFYGAKLVIEGDLTVGELVAFNILSGRVSAPVLRLAQIWQDFHQARVSVARLGDILNTVAEPTFSHGRTTLPTIQGNISFEHVTFRYRPDAPEVLHDITFNVQAGQVVGIVGSSGSGKSTLAKLVQRLYVPASGRVLVDGVDLALVDLPWLRRQVGVVLQDNVLFNRTIRDNIALSDPTIPMERIIAAAQLAGAHEFILELTESYDTLVGERGSTLSGGQKQRIAIARALVTNPRIMIFDEATSALDYESERIIQENMRQISQGRTVLIIAHRLSTVRRADRIITIERGRIVEDGTHDELMGTNGRYAKLHYLQAGIHDVR